MATFGQGGQYRSSMPDGIGSILTQGNMGMAQGIMNLSDKIGDAMKQRGQEAKTKKKETDLAKAFLNLAFDKAKASGSPLPTITDTDGNEMSITKEEIPNLTHEQAVPTFQAMMQFQKYNQGEAGIKKIESDIGYTDKQGEFIDQKMDVFDENQKMKAEQHGMNKALVAQTLNKNFLDASALRKQLTSTEQTDAAFRQLITSSNTGPYASEADAQKGRLEVIANDPKFKHADFGKVMQMHNNMIDSEPWETKGTTVTIGGKEYPMVYTSKNSAVPANTGKQTVLPQQDEAIPGSNGMRRGIKNSDGTYSNVYTVDRGTRVTEETNINLINEKLTTHKQNLAQLKQLKSKGVKKANYNDNEVEGNPAVVVGEAGFSFGNENIDDAIAKEEAAVSELEQQLGRGGAGESELMKKFKAQGK